MSKSAVIHFINNCFCLRNMLVSCKSCRLPQLQSFSALARESTVNLSDPVDTLQVRFSLDPGKACVMLEVFWYIVALVDLLWYSAFSSDKHLVLCTKEYPNYLVCSVFWVVGTWSPPLDLQAVGLYIGAGDLINLIYSLSWHSIQTLLMVIKVAQPF